MKIEVGKTYEATHRSNIYAEGDRFTVDWIREPDEKGRVFVAVTFENGRRHNDTIDQLYPEFLKEVKNVSKPAHYDTGIDTIAFMRANCPPEQVEGFLRGNALKYLQRYPSKGTPVEDLKKARHYIEMLIEEVEGRG